MSLDDPLYRMDAGRMVVAWGLAGNRTRQLGDTERMSFIDGISGAVGSLQSSRAALPTALATGQQPGGPTAGAAVTTAFDSVFKRGFDQSMGTVFASAAKGEFDDPNLRLQEAALANRIAQQQTSLQQDRSELDLDLSTPAHGTTAGNRSTVTGGGPGATITAATTTGSIGAHAAPTPTANSSLIDRSALVADTQTLLQLRARSADARLTNLSTVLKSKFPKAEALISASSGTWDPATYVPKTQADAEAFAQRMTIDVSEAAAQLDVLQSKVEVARFEAQTTGGPAATAKLAELEALLGRQQAWVTKLAGIVDKMSGGELTDAGADAIAGNTARTAVDVPVDQIVGALRKAGRSENEIKAVVGAGEVAVEEMPVDRVVDIMKQAGKSSAEIAAVVGEEALTNAKPGPHRGSERLDRIAKKANDFALDMWRHQQNVNERHEQERERAEERHQEDQRITDQAIERKYSERRSLDGMALNKASERKAAVNAMHQQAGSQRQNDFQAFIAALDQRASETRNLRQAG